jgi:hypothetical protein
MNSLLYLTFGLLTKNTPFDAIVASSNISLPEKETDMLALPMLSTLNF